jgi:hypothetical protein
MQYFKPFTYFALKKPGGWKNVLLAAVCVLIPVVGAIVLLGYRAEIAEDLDRDPRLEEYPDFDFNRFVDYLSRGVWPFLMQLIVSVAVLVPLALLVLVGVLVAYATDEPLIGFGIGGLLLVPVIVLAMLVLWPLELHAQLTGKFDFGRALAFTGRYLKRVWGQALMAAVAYWFFSVLLIPIGYLACIVGVYPAAIIVSMAQQHYVAQLYRLYLDEGGEPIAGSLGRLEFDEE